MGNKLLWLLLLLLISLASAGLHRTNSPNWRSRVASHPKLHGKGDYQILSRRSPPERHPWKPPYNRRG